jgi:hypothetical protein
VSGAVVEVCWVAAKGDWGGGGGCGMPGQRKKKTKTHPLFWVSVLGVVDADVVGKVMGAAMGDQGSGHGCGTPVQKEKKKEKKKLTFFWSLYWMWWVGM